MLYLLFDLYANPIMKSVVKYFGCVKKASYYNSRAIFPPGVLPIIGENSSAFLRKILIFFRIEKAFYIF